MSNFDYIVVGAGIEGSATAYWLAKNGVKTLLLDQFRQGHTRGSSHGNSRITRKAYDEPQYVHMMQRAYQLWDELEKEVGEQLFKKTGLLLVGAVDGHEIGAVEASMGEHKLPFTRLNHQEIRQRFPTLKFDEHWEGLYDPEAGLLKADRCLRAFQDQLVKRGGVFHDGDEVIDFKASADGVKIRTASGVEFSAKGAAVCAGTWAKSFLDAHLGLKLPLQPRVVKSCYWKVEKKGLYAAGNFPCVLTNYDSRKSDKEDQMAEYYGVPSDEYTDLFKFCSHTGVDIDHPDQRDSVDASLYVRKPAEFLANHFQHVQTKPAIVEICLYTVTPDDDFVLDKHPKHGNVVIGAGFSGHGFKFGAVVGEILGSFLLNRQLPFDLNKFRIDRFK
jgi:sarcosine oxidase/L-pipecolate oxidase